MLRGRLIAKCDGCGATEEYDLIPTDDSSQDDITYKQDSINPLSNGWFVSVDVLDRCLCLHCAVDALECFLKNKVNKSDTDTTPSPSSTEVGSTREKLWVYVKQRPYLHITDCQHPTNTDPFGYRQRYYVEAKNRQQALNRARKESGDNLIQHIMERDVLEGPPGEC